MQSKQIGLLQNPLLTGSLHSLTGFLPQETQTKFLCLKQREPPGALQMIHLFGPFAILKPQCSLGGTSEVILSNFHSSHKS